MKFSIRALLTAVTGVCCLLSLALLTRENRRLTRANAELRNELGGIGLPDEGKLYTNRMQSSAQRQRVWNVHTPKGTRYSLCLQTKDMAFPDHTRRRVGERLFDLQPGQHWIAACAQRDGDKWTLLIVCDNDWVTMPIDGNFLQYGPIVYWVDYLSEGSKPLPRVDLCREFDAADQPEAGVYRNGILLWLDRTL